VFSWQDTAAPTRNFNRLFLEVLSREQNLYIQRMLNTTSQRVFSVVELGWVDLEYSTDLSYTLPDILSLVIEKFPCT